MTTQTANPTRSYRLRRAFTAAVLTAGLALLAVLAAPAQAGNPPPPSPYSYGICAPNQSCPTFRLPRPAGWLVDRLGRVRRVTPAPPSKDKLPPGVWRGAPGN